MYLLNYKIYYLKKLIGSFMTFVTQDDTYANPLFLTNRHQLLHTFYFYKRVVSHTFA